MEMLIKRQLEQQKLKLLQQTSPGSGASFVPPGGGPTGQ